MASIGNYAYILTCKLRVATHRKAVDPLGFAHALRHLGDAHAHAGQAARARTCYLEALSIYRSQPDRRPLDLANAIRSLAALGDETGATEEAERLWQEAHDLYALLNVPGGVAESAARLALLAWRRGDRRESREFLADATAAANTGDDAEARKYVREVSAQIES
jgi:tetratricopeptide (TPR) repeat protein